MTQQSGKRRTQIHGRRAALDRRTNQAWRCQGASAATVWLQQLSAPRWPAAAPVNQMHRLEGCDTIEIAPARQQEVTGLEGTLWMAHDQVLADHIVERGERYLAASGSGMRLHALRHAHRVVSTLRA